MSQSISPSVVPSGNLKILNRKCRNVRTDPRALLAVLLASLCSNSLVSLADDKGKDRAERQREQSKDRAERERENDKEQRERKKDRDERQRERR